MPNYYRDRLVNALLNQWNIRAANNSLGGARFEHDGARYWWVYAPDGRIITNWECRPFPGNASLVVTTAIELRQDLRGQGLGKYFHELRRRAYKAAGFHGEVCTVRSDSEAQTSIVVGSGAVCMATLPSDFGGTFNVWMLPLNTTNTYTLPPLPERPLTPPPVIVPPAHNMIVRTPDRPLLSSRATPPRPKLFAHRTPR